ncbi:UNVERIFIED_CONTAM: ribosomal-protein-alanine N-acetyltransferase [Acetivibrio alkalicellulosi]
MNYKSECLTYREFKEGDFHLFHSVFSNEKVMKYALVEKFDRGYSLSYFNKVLANNILGENRKAYEFAVYLSSSSIFIGFADIEIQNRKNLSGCGEIGYFLLPSFWGNGFACEIANTLLEISFRHIKLHRVSASCNSNNIQSENIMKKIGMIKEGEFRKVRYKNGQWDNELRYSILVEDWILCN